GRLQLYRDQLQTYTAADASGAAPDPLDVAAALLALQVGDDGPAPRDPGNRTQADVEGIPSSSARFDRAAPAPRRQAQPEKGRIGFERPRTDDNRPLNRRTPGRPSRETVYRVAVGHTDGSRSEAIVGAIPNEGRLRGSYLGKIEI